MKVLLIHNNNVSEKLRIIDSFSNEDNEFHVFPVSQSESSTEDYDTFLSRQVADICMMEDDNGAVFDPDLIVMPFSLSQINPIELTGIRLALHMRLDDNNILNRLKPILFIGPDTLEECVRINSCMADFLCTPQVYTSHLGDYDSLVKWMEDRHQVIKPLTHPQYSLFLGKVRIEIPGNFNDSHHSVTNRWALTRWAEMFDWGETPIKMGKNVTELENSLYFKHIQASLGRRERFGRRTRDLPGIPDIPGMKIAYIDDEYSLGWEDLLGRIAKKSGATLSTYTGFDSSLSRDQLVESVKSFVDNEDADCYVLDLRLHEDDHLYRDDYEQLTGHRIAEYIYKKNHGSHIIIFTASEKVENYLISEKFFYEYVMKENPSIMLGKQESKERYNKFARALQKAYSRKYLRNFYPICSGLPYLEDFFEILRQDDEDDRISHGINMRSAALNLIVYIESTVKSKFWIEGNRLVRQPNIVEDVHECCIQCDNSTHPKTPLKYGSFSGLLPIKSNDLEWYRIVDQKDSKGNQNINDIGMICATLHAGYHLGDNIIDDVITLKNIRNKTVAHGGGQSMIDKDLLIRIFDNVVKRMAENVG